VDMNSSVASAVVLAGIHERNVDRCAVEFVRTGNRCCDGTCMRFGGGSGVRHLIYANGDCGGAVFYENEGHHVLCFSTGRTVRLGSL